MNTILTKENKGGKNVDGVRTLGLSKTYKSMTGGSDVEALKNAYFEINTGQLLGVMGHNGAGKSTMINTICGLISKNSGTARVGGFNIDENLRSIRKRMGVVSQFDVLWDELTGIEHMHLF
jgi:ABC-2 type transport system ATP-binding protein